MTTELDFQTEDITLDALLDKINEQRKVNNALQSDIRAFKSRENRLNKTSEAIKSENRRLHEEIATLEQKIRELDIQLTLPESERTYISSRPIDPLPKKSVFHKFNWGYIIAPMVVISSIIAFKWFWTSNNVAPTTAISSSLTPSVTTQSIAVTDAVTPTSNATPNAQTAATPATNAVPAIEEGYLVVHNPLISDDPVRIRDGFGNRAREVAFVDPGTKFKIREQSPNKMKRAISVNNKTLTVEDYFYRISDKEQWIFGFFTNRRTYNLVQ